MTALALDIKALFLERAVSSKASMALLVVENFWPNSSATFFLTKRFAFLKSRALGELSLANLAKVL
ncbi:MAG: hypothetical protein KJ977_01870, partial [Candidatus Omnitrophica bacterium]|nr:hypothetical protein [Candidatus Omnitrophota bacterium]